MSNRKPNANILKVMWNDLWASIGYINYNSFYILFCIGTVGGFGLTEKRYTVGEQLKVVDDNILKGTFYVCTDRAEALKIADKLNEFHNENVRLVKENEQFKKQVDKIDFILEDLNGAEYITRDDAIEALNKIDKVIE